MPGRMVIPMEMILKPVFLGLVNNAALLLALAFLYDLFTRGADEQDSWPKRLLAGLLLGGMAMALMLEPWELFPGLFFDTRSILLGVTGLFFGVLPTVAAMAMAVSLRVAQGGLGLYVGCAVILASGSWGLPGDGGARGPWPGWASGSSTPSGCCCIWSCWPACCCCPPAMFWKPCGASPCRSW